MKERWKRLTSAVAENLDHDDEQLEVERDLLNVFGRLNEVKQLEDFIILAMEARSLSRGFF